jgi:hypothetical protein
MADRPGWPRHGRSGIFIEIELILLGILLFAPRLTP